MAYDDRELWSMFMGFLKNAADDDLRIAGNKISKDRREYRDADIQSAVDNGSYGESARSMWEHFKKANS